MRKFLFIFLTIGYAFSSMLDSTNVNTDFDERGLPIFKNSSHRLNWCLERLKPSKFIISNNSTTNAKLSYAIKQKGRDCDFLKTITPFEHCSFRECLGLDENAGLVFSESSSRKLRIASQTASYFSVFQTADIIIEAGKSFEFDISFGWLREARLTQNYRIDFEGNVVRINIIDTQDEISQSPTEFLSKLYCQEYLDGGKKVFRNKIAYEFHDWESFTVNEPWLGIHRKFLLKFYESNGLTLSDVVNKRRRVIERSQNILSEALSPGATAVDSECLIPKIMHKIWITSNSKPSAIPLDRLKHYLNQVKMNPTFQHVLWVFDKRKSAEIIKEHPEIVDDITIRSLDEIWAEFRGKDLFSRLFDNSRYTACSDVARANIVNLFGGIYADFGVEFKMSPLFLCQKFNIFMMRELFLLSGTSFGARPGHQVFNKTLEFFDNIDRFPVESRSIGHDNPLVPWCAYGILTAMFDIHINEEDKFMPIPFSKLFVDVNQMHSWGGPRVGLGQQSTSSSPVSDNEWFGVQYIASPDKGYTYEGARWDAVHTHKMSKILFGKEKEYIEQKRRDLTATSIATYQALARTPVNVIPHTTHRCWLTNLANPSEAPDDRLDYYIQGVRIHKGWKHYFWCQDPDLIPKTITKLLSADVGIEIKTLADIEPKMRGKHVFDAILADNRYTNANDVLRMNIVDEYGGFYCDLGVELKRNLTSLIDDYHYFILQAGEGYIDHTTIAAAPHSELTSAYLDRVDSLYLLSEEAKKITPHPSAHISWTGCSFMASYIDCQLPRDTKILFLSESSGILVQLHRMNTWNNIGKFGNMPVNKTTLDILSLRP